MPDTSAIEREVPHRIDSTDPSTFWAVTVLHVHGLRFLRPEKSWRPIVTVVIDEHETHETILGSSGQCINMKKPFLLHGANIGSQVEINVWHQSQTKKKTKKRKLVASASHTLGELSKKEPKVELRLSCQTPTRTTTASRGKPQSGAYLTLRVQPPKSLTLSSNSSNLADDVTWSNPNQISDSPISSVPSSPSSQSSELRSPEIVSNDLPEEEKRKQPRIRGYRVCTSEEDWGDCDDDGKSLPDLDISIELDSTFESIRGVDESTLDLGSWIAASLLPQYTDKVSIASTMSVAESALSSFTMYGELQGACLDSQFEHVLSKIQAEWYFVGASLIALAGLNATVFGISPSNSFFGIDGFGKRAVAAGSAASGLGICIDAYFLLRYAGADAGKFQRLAMDVYGGYFYFCLSSRLPAMCMFVSSCALMAFLISVAWEAWSIGVVVMCLCAGILLSLQFIVYGVHQCVRTTIRLCRRVTAIYQRSSDSPPPPPPS